MNRRPESSKVHVCPSFSLRINEGQENREPASLLPQLEELLLGISSHISLEAYPVNPTANSWTFLGKVCMFSCLGQVHLEFVKHEVFQLSC